ncbi:hypothetical protein JXA47_01715 [Candidatus Sumerlaeota bacterium]|nr:hypothetical protein [Candidatus Sumerlaeota bacterium]
MQRRLLPLLGGLFSLLALLTPRLGAVEGDLILESRPQPSQGLVGHRIILSPSHGRTWNEEHLWWGWQRTMCFGELEDLITPRIINRWLVGYFQNAGATVLTTRERDEQLNEIRIDDAAVSGEFESTGTWTPWIDSSAWQGSAQVATAQSGGGGPTATWYADFPATDRYGLCLWVPQTGNPTSDARYIIHTAGGDVSLRLNQTVNNSQWFWIDWFVFPAGDHRPVLTLTTESDDVGTMVVADAVRLGGGMGDVDWGGGVSGLPRWQEYAKSYALTYGAPQWVWDEYVTGADYQVRWNMGRWLGGDFQLELHTNADATGSGTQTGTMTPWMVARNPSEEVELRAAHDHLVNTIRERWDPTWRDGGIDDVLLYPTYHLPHWLPELAYHDRLEPDLLNLVDPDFRSIAARAFYESIAEIVAGDSVVFLPEPPEAPAAENLGGGQVRISWNPPSWGPAPDTYRLFASQDAMAFDLGQDVGPVTETVVSGHSAGDILFFRVAAENAGGRSFPTEVVGVHVGEGEPFLVVNGFDRWDQKVQEPNNPRRFVLEHIGALAAVRPDRPIDSCANEAVIGGGVLLGDYALCDWILGRESVDDETLSSAEQALLTSYLGGGGRLLATGTDVGYDLIANGSAADEAFAEGTLHMRYVSHGSSVRKVTGRAGTPFAGLILNLSDGTNGLYDVTTPDVLSPGLGGEVVLTWAGSSDAAGIGYAGGPGKALTLASPLEAIVTESERNQLALAAVDYLLSPPVPDTEGPSLLILEVINIGPSVATLHWVTDEPATGEVEWGLTAAYGSTTPATTTHVAEDTITLTSLDPETEHHARLRVADYLGNETISVDLVFTTEPPDTTAPVFSDIEVIAVSDRDAIVHWVTDELSTTQVDWGLTTAYGHTTPEDPTYTTSHWIRVSGLPSSYLLHWRPVSRDLADNTGQGPDTVLFTLATIGGVIVDNSDPGFEVTVGDWSTGSSSSDKYGADYRFASVGAASSEAQWSATLPQRGLWQAQCWYPQGSNRTTEAPYTVISSEGTERILVNQQINGGQFNSLGSPRFFEGPEARIVIDDMTSTGNVVLADAVRWVFVGLGEPGLWQTVECHGFMLLGE